MQPHGLPVQKRPDRPHFISIVTPNSTHFPAARLALENGFAVVCEKPLATNSRDAEALARLVRDTGLLFCVTYAYSGYPMVKHLRDMIRAGEIGDIRFVNGEYPQEWLMTKLEDTGQKQAAWRTDPKLAGASNCVGDIGSLIDFMAAHMTGLEIETLCARLDRFGAGRPLDDRRPGTVLAAATPQDALEKALAAIGEFASSSSAVPD